MGVVDKLNQIKSCKEDIKQAIIDKGVDMTDVAFTEYATKIREISGGSTPEVDDTDYIEYTNLIYVQNQALMGLSNLIQIKFGADGLYHERLEQDGFITDIIQGDGNYLNLEIFSPDGFLYTGVYNAAAVGGTTNAGEFAIGYDADWGGGFIMENWGSVWWNHTSLSGSVAIGKITDGTATVLVENDNLILKLKSSTVNVKLTKPLSEISDFQVIDNGGGEEPSIPADFDYLAYRNSMTSYSNDDPNCNPSEYSFCGCQNLQTVDIPNSTFIGAGAFKNCPNLTTVNIPNTFTISDYAFENCGALTTIDLPVASNVGMQGFQYCGMLSSVNIPNCYSILSYAFNGCNLLTSIDLPNCIHIDSWAFGGCNSLTSVNAPICTKIGDYAFAWLGSITEANIPEVKNIGQAAFVSNNLQTVNLPKCNHIKTDCFAQNYALTSVNIPKCGRISQGAFSDCNLLTTLDLRDIYYCVLEDAAAFNNTPLMNGEGTIYVNAASLDKYKSDWAWSAFADRFVGVGDPDVVLLVFEDGRVYGDTTMLFDGYTDYLGISTDMVISLDLPNAADMTEQTMWWSGMFQGYPNLQTVAIGKLETVYANMFNSCGALTSVNLPECKNVMDGAFASCFSLTTVNLPECGYVANQAFGSCGSLTSVNLPKCTYIADWAFQGCDNLKTLTIGTELTDQICEISGTTLPDSIQAIFVPEAMVDTYKMHWMWCNYAYKIFAVGTEPVIPDIPDTPDTPSNLSDWYVVGNFNGWTLPDPNTQMIIENDWYVLRNLTVDGQNLIFVKGMWEDQRHVVGDFTGVGEAVSLAFEGSDIIVPAGTYDVYLNAATDTAYFMEVGQTPF